MLAMSTIVWFRRDLRLADNPAWSAATDQHDAVTALFVLEPKLWRSAASMRRALLRGHLQALDEQLRGFGGRLRIEIGEPAKIVPAVAGETGASTVFVNADYSPHSIARDAAVAETVHLESFAGLAVHAPGEILTAAGTPPRVFTPYWKRWKDHPWGLWPAAGDVSVAAEPGADLPDEETPPFECGEAAARDRLHSFLERVDDYTATRDRPDLDATSRLSSDLHFGTLDPRRVRHETGETTQSRIGLVRQLCWRDFYLQVLWQHPRSLDLEFRPEYRGMPWRNDDAGFAAWAAGTTGYPIVDAGMRQLREEGYIHNRVRMIAASFLVKDLLIDWRLGERWFRRHLVDGDIAQNAGNWQWVAGTGTDAAPYFRVFNPVSQSRKFDPDGRYIHRYVPELRELEAPGVHAPWKVGPLELASAGITLGETYPEPMVDHAMARKRAIAAYEAARGASNG